MEHVIYTPEHNIYQHNKIGIAQEISISALVVMMLIMRVIVKSVSVYAE